MAQLNKPKFSSSLTAILSIIGVAIGLGNVWRFPYMMGKYGGSAFLFFYLIFVIIFAIPALTGELSLGRFLGKGPVGAFSALFNPFIGKSIAYIISSALLVVNAYYIVVIANIIYLAFYSGVYGFGNSSHDLTGVLCSSTLQLVLSVAVLILVLLVVIQGLKKGIERISKIFVQVFGFIMLYLLFHVLALPGAFNKLCLFLRPDFNQITILNVLDRKSVV